MHWASVHGHAVSGDFVQRPTQRLRTPRGYPVLHPGPCAIAAASFSGLRLNRSGRASKCCQIVHGLPRCRDGPRRFAVRVTVVHKARTRVRISIGCGLPTCDPNICFNHKDPRPTH